MFIFDKVLEKYFGYFRPLILQLMVKISSFFSFLTFQAQTPIIKFALLAVNDLFRLQNRNSLQGISCVGIELSVLEQIVR